MLTTAISSPESRELASKCLTSMQNGEGTGGMISASGVENSVFPPPQLCSAPPQLLAHYFRAKSIGDSLAFNTRSPWVCEFSTNWNSKRGIYNHPFDHCQFEFRNSERKNQEEGWKEISNLTNNWTFPRYMCSGFSKRKFKHQPATDFFVKVPFLRQ